MATGRHAKHWEGVSECRATYLINSFMRISAFFQLNRFSDWCRKSKHEVMVVKKE